MVPIIWTWQRVMGISSFFARLEETAAALDIPRGTVSSRQKRALELLRLDLTDHREVDI